MNLRIITKNHAADSKIESPRKIDFRADWTHESIPTAWELSRRRWEGVVDVMQSNITRASFLMDLEKIATEIPEKVKI